MDVIKLDFTPVTKELVEWGANTEHFDPEVLRANNTLFEASDSKGVVGYVVVQTPALLGPFVVSPAAGHHQVSVMLREAMLASRLLAQRQGIGDLYVFTSDPSVEALAVKMGMEKMPETAIYRIKTYKTG